jgi:hypothetical protein
MWAPSSADQEAATTTLADLQRHTERARDMTGGAVWRAAARAPWLGDDVTAARTAVAVIDDVAQDVMPPLVQAAQGIDPSALAPKDGAVDLAPLQAAAPHLAEAEAAMQAAEHEVAKIDTSGVHPRIAGPVQQLREAITEAASTTSTASRAAALLPPMLGAVGPAL